MNRKPNIYCSVCALPIYRRPGQISSGAVYCSLICCGKSQQKNKLCPICKKSFIGPKTHCSRMCANKSRSGSNYYHINTSNKAYQGRALKEKVALTRDGRCERCGHENYAILEVHHKLERFRGGDDSLSNLELLCPNCHTAHHRGHSLYKPEKML